MKWTHDDMREAICTSGSISQVLKKLGLRPSGGNYTTVKSFIVENNMDTSHFHGQGWRKGKTFGPIRSLDEVMVFTPGKRNNSDRLRKRLIKEGRKEARCEKCGLKEWMGKPIPLELNHINGCRCDNREENLEILCRNCHGQCETDRGKNRVGYGEGRFGQRPWGCPTHPCRG